ncbi:MAG: YbjN domain-containing protein [Spirulina sp. DLM2.Bin59]|nr:MAG: YbjN domain-containing protein [Spirulina sp. DLM2.Bin59]
MTLFDLVVETLKTDDWSFNIVEPGETIAFGITLDSGQFRCYFCVDDENDCIQLVTVMPAAAPAEKFAPLCEFICRANYGLPLGGLAIDLTDGEMQYKTSISLHDVPANMNMIRNLMYPNFTMVDLYFPALMKIVYGDVDPETMMAIIDQQLEDEDDEDEDDDFLNDHFSPHDLN